MKLYSFDEADDLEIGQVNELYQKYSNQKLPDLYRRFSFGREIFNTAQGSFLYKKGGTKVFDFTGGLGVANMGHNHPRIKAVRQRFVSEDRLEIHKSYLNRFLAAASANLAAILPNDLDYSFFCNSGAEAVDGALKLAYRYHMGERAYVLRSDRSFHGKTIGAGSLSYGDNFVSGPARFSFQKMPGVLTYNFNSLSSVEENIRQKDGDIYAIFVEPFSCSTLTESSETFLKGVRALCDKHDILLVFDEIYSGFAKCGPNFYMQKYGVTPDIVCLSKALGGGKSSISAYVARVPVFEKAYGSSAGALLHSTTYNSFGEECATVIESTRILVDEKLSERSYAIEAVLKERLGKLAEKYKSRIKEVRGSGTHYGIILNPALSVFEPVLKVIPIDFVRDPNFLKKLAVTSMIEEYYVSADTLCAFTSNQDVILNFSPAPIADPEEVASRIDAFEPVLEKGVQKCILSFVSKNV